MGLASIFRAKSYIFWGVQFLSKKVYFMGVSYVFVLQVMFVKYSLCVWMVIETVLCI